MKYFEVGIAL